MFEHSHECPTCDAIWDCKGSECLDQIFSECPNCENKEKSKYTGSEPASMLSRISAELRSEPSLNFADKIRFADRVYSIRKAFENEE